MKVQNSGTDTKEVQEKHNVENSDCLQPKLNAGGYKLFMKYFRTSHWYKREIIWLMRIKCTEM